MTGVRLSKHEAVPQYGSYEVRYPDKRPSQYFLLGDVASRHLRPDNKLWNKQKQLRELREAVVISRHRSGHSCAR